MNLEITKQQVAKLERELANHRDNAAQATAHAEAVEVQLTALKTHLAKLEVTAAESQPAN